MNNVIENIIREIDNKNYSRAIELCEELIESQPDNEHIYEIKAGCHLALMKFDDAVLDFGRAISLAISAGAADEDIAKLYHKRGKTYVKLSDYENAAGDFKLSLERFTDTPAVHNDYAACLRRLERYDEALGFCSKAIDLDPTAAEYFNNRGNIHFCLGNTEDSIRDYDRAILLNNQYSNAYFNRGCIYYESLGNIEQAKKDWLKAVELNPEYKSEIANYVDDVNDITGEVPANENENPDIDIRETVSGESGTDSLEDIADKISIIPLNPSMEQQYPDEELNDREEVTKEKAGDESPAENIKTADKETTEEFAKVSELFPDLKSPSDIVKDNSVSFSDYQDIFDKDATKDLTSGKVDDITVPDIDFKSIFRENSGEPESINTEESDDNRNVSIEEIKILHDEIEKPVSDEPVLKGFTGISDSTEEKTENLPSEQYRHTDESNRSWYAHPAVLALFIAAFVFLGIFVVYEFLIKPNISTVTVNLPKDSAANKTEQVKDTVAPVVENKQQTEETAKDEQKNETAAPQTKQGESKFLGYLSDKQKFALFSEQDGYYVQIGSFKEKSAAEEKLKLLKENNIKGMVFEADLKEKGLYFRVRAGAFETPEIAKEQMSVLEK
ncbi:MAG TPA: tetratricopeptide repeat protein [Ignavibacteria bacterium]|nr:tetratricopeptide repeat protein [Ignavibacteria bacterium]